MLPWSSIHNVIWLKEALLCWKKLWRKQVSFSRNFCAEKFVDELLGWEVYRGIFGLRSLSRNFWADKFVEDFLGWEVCQGTFGWEVCEGQNLVISLWRRRAEVCEGEVGLRVVKKKGWGLWRRSWGCEGEAGLRVVKGWDLWRRSWAECCEGEAWFVKEKILLLGWIFGLRSLSRNFWADKFVEDFFGMRSLWSNF